MMSHITSYIAYLIPTDILLSLDNTQKTMSLTGFSTIYY